MVAKLVLKAPPHLHMHRASYTKSTVSRVVYEVAVGEVRIGHVPGAVVDTCGLKGRMGKRGG
jgi:hypothetical protein